MSRVILAAGAAVWAVAIVACMSKTKEPEQQQAVPEPGAPQQKVEAAGGPFPGVAIPLEKPAAPRPELKWADVGEGAILPPVGVVIQHVVIGKVALRDSIRSATTKSAEDYLAVTFWVFNLSDAKKVNYRSWHQEFTLGRDVAVLRDEFGNVYKRVGFGLGTQPVGAVKSESIYPKTNIEDVLVFERPVDKATRLELELPGGNCDVEGTFRFRFPTEPVRTGKYYYGPPKEVPAKKGGDTPAAPDPPKSEDKKPAEVPPAREDLVNGRTLADRKAIYGKLSLALAEVEAAAVKRFGKKPGRDDPASLAVPYKAYVDFARNKMFSELEKTDGVRRSHAEAILAEGDAAGWPKK